MKTLSKKQLFVKHCCILVSACKRSLAVLYSVLDEEVELAPAPAEQNLAADHQEVPQIPENS